MYLLKNPGLSVSTVQCGNDAQSQRSLRHHNTTEHSKVRPKCHRSVNTLFRYRDSRVQCEEFQNLLRIELFSLNTRGHLGEVRRRCPLQRIEMQTLFNINST